MAYLDTLTKKVNILPTGIPTPVHLSQSENGRTLSFEIVGGSGELPAGSVVTLTGTKPDGVVYSAVGTLSGNIATFEEDVQLTAAAGVWPAKIEVTNGGHMIATGRISFTIDADPVAPGSVPSESELDGLVAQAAMYAETARSAAYGSPLTAATAADMIDTTRVYVYTGNETGMENGHWYYWEDGSWKDGGIYNAAAVQTDTSLSIPGMAADAAATGRDIAAEADAREAADTALQTAIDAKADTSALTAETEAREEAITDLKADFNQLNEFTFNPTSEPFHELNNTSSFFTSKPGYYTSTNGWSESYNYNSYYLNLPKGTKMYFKRTGVTNQFRLYIYKTDDISSGGHIAHYTSSDDIPVTELTAMTLGQDSTVVISLTAAQDSSSSWSAFFNYFVLGEKLNLHSLVPSIQKLYGKTIYCFGDSITGMFEAPTDYPSYIAKLTGANCVNVGFSGTRMSTYQDLYVGMSMYNLATSIASGDWTAQQNTINQFGKTEWQAKKDLLASTNWNNVDGITIFFGTNDYGNGAYVNDETGATESKSVGQSLNYAIKTILTAYPHLQILVVTPIWREYSNDAEATQDSDVSPNTNGHYLIDYVDAEISIANKNHIPALDMYRDSQFSKYTKTLLLSDGTHPTATGLERIGNMIGEKLIECFL